MGLLDGMQAPQSSGLLGAMGQAGGGSDTQMAVQMATELMKSPTPQTGQKIIAALRQYPGKESDQIAQVLMQSLNDPEALRGIAQSVLSHLSQ